MADDKPIIVVKKKGGHGGHHGGAWKVAYADFVTAMMAFFMVMWLLNSAEVATKQAIATYFRKPGIFKDGSGTPVLAGGVGILPDSYAPPKADDPNKKWEIRKRVLTTKEEAQAEAAQDKPKLGESPVKPKQTPDPRGINLAEQIEATPVPVSKIKSTHSDITGNPLDSYTKEKNIPDPGDTEPKDEYKEYSKIVEQKIKQQQQQILGMLGSLEVRVDKDGLNIEIMDTDQVSMFARGSSKVLPEARIAFRKLAEIIAPFPNSIEIIGHTDSKPFSNITGGYTNWELSTARANEARKLLEEDGIEPSKIRGVVGKADTELRNKEDAFASINRRITLKMKFDISKNINVGSDPQAIEKAKIEALTPTAAPSANASQPPPLNEGIPEVAPSPAETDSGTPIAAATVAQSNISSIDRFRPSKVFAVETKSKKTITLPDVDLRIETSGGESEGEEKDSQKLAPPPQPGVLGTTPKVIPDDFFAE